MEDRVEYVMLFTALSVIALMMLMVYQGAKMGILRVRAIFARPVSTPASPPHDGTTVEGQQSIFSIANRKSPDPLVRLELPDFYPPSHEIDGSAASCAVVTRDPVRLPGRPRSPDWELYERPTVCRRGLAIDDAPRW